MLQCIGIFLLNFILYFLFGAFFTARKAYAKDGEAVGLTIIAGFFLYYSLFTLFAVPIMYRWRPLSMLSLVWVSFCAVLLVASVILNRKYIKLATTDLFDEIKKNRWFYFALFAVVITECVIVLYSYQFTLDAAYYVSNVTTSVQTNSLNIYDPYTGDWQDHFEMRYFFATYPLQDAVMCYIFKIPALYQTKIVMAAVVIFITNLLYYMIGKRLFGENHQLKVFLMVLFAGVINFFFITIYTSSNFLLTRTYEGKSILGNIILPMILYLYIRILQDEKNNKWWVLLFLTCFGSTVISNSSNMLVPAALLVMMVPVAVNSFIKKDVASGIKTLIKTGVCMLPGIILMLVYVAYVKGMFVFYTYPR